VDATAPDPLVGRTLDGRYRVIARLARGGMATVYEGVDTRLDRPVALKVMHPGLAEDHAFVARFSQEARSAARLSHPGVVAVYDQGEDSGTVFLAMEFVRGRTLRDLLRERGRLSPREALDVLEPVLAALGAAHRAGLVHRDVKPENVLLADDGRVKVADFGLARAATTGAASQSTQHGVLIGTVAYLSPEQVQQGRTDTRSDVYSAGILLYEMLTGGPPFSGDNPMAVAFQHVHEDVPAPSAAVPGLSPELDRLVATATSRAPDARPADADRLLALVETTRERLTPAELGFSTAGPAVVDLADTLVVPIAGQRQPVAAGVAAGTAGATQATRPPTAPGGPGGAGAGAPPADAGPPPSGPAVIPAPEGPVPVVRRRRRPVLVFLTVLLALAAVVGAGTWYLAAGRTVVTPSVVGLTPEAAEAALTQASLQTGLGQPQFSETVKAGLVISSDPAAGAEVRRDGTVTLVVSRGPERYAVPDLKGKTVTEASAALAAVNLTLGQQTQEYSQSVAKGDVISSAPEAGTKVKRDTAVRVVVSRGLPPVEVPRLTGLSLDAAKKAVAAKKLKLTTSAEQYNESVAKGSVISQSPAAGKTVLQGSTVSVVVSKGPPLVAVPSVTDRKAADAVRILEAAGFKVKVNRPPVVFLNRVISQSPGAGSQAPKGSTVTITVV
jgi:serine/threonine-protein kinase